MMRCVILQLPHTPRSSSQPRAHGIVQPCTGSTSYSGSCMSNTLQSSDNKRFPILMCRLTAGFDEALLVFGKDTSQKHAEVIREIKAGKSPGCLVGGGTPLLRTRSQKRTLETSGSQILKSSFFCLLVICIQNDVKMVRTSIRLPFFFVSNLT